MSHLVLAAKKAKTFTLNVGCVIWCFGLCVCVIDILSAGPNHWIFMWLAMLDNFLTDFAPAGEPTHVGVLPHGSLPHVST